MWFRRDLRLADHPALSAAASAGRVVGLFIVNRDILSGTGPARAHFLHECLTDLRSATDEALVLREGPDSEVLQDICRESGATSVFATADHAPYGRRRDAAVAAALAAEGITLQLIDSNYLVTPGSILNKTGTPFKVFTAFRRVWDQFSVPTPLPVPSGIEWWRGESLLPSRICEVAATQRPDFFGGLPDSASGVHRGGESIAREVLDNFAPRVDAYDEIRNLPGRDETSRLGPHLRFGTIHPRQVLAATGDYSDGSRVFASEICWREFYADVMFHHPDSVHVNLQSSMDALRVDVGASAEEKFRQWARGETGYPLVDAGMRQLLEKGWMHNRVRMVTASFLIKHLHLDWRWGARWFMWNLVDGDIASNQHGWQWTAGTGTDASPYYRVFNPTLQAERFDPHGTYVHRFIPELVATPAPQCLQPGGGEGLLRPASYPAPMIDAAAERVEALARLAEAKEVR